ncbi:MAG: hypothetical protein HYY84_13665 [Deltaproteobacteria bacterium]|nr:hypothetical protein [Deltaproteobacteria bacterium]
MKRRRAESSWIDDVRAAAWEAQVGHLPAFKCRHAHCAERRMRDVIKMFASAGDGNCTKKRNHM